MNVIRTSQLVFRNTRIIRSEADLPPLNGSNQHPLEAGINYQYDGIIDQQYPFLLPSNGSCAILGNTSIDGMNWTGGATAIFVGANIGAVVHEVKDFFILGNDTATLFDLASSDEGSVFASFNTIYVGMADLGDIAGVGSVNFILSPIFGTGVGLTISGFNDCLLDTSIQQTTSGSPVTFYDIDMDEGSIFSVLDNTVNLKDGDSLLNVTTSASDWRMVVQSNAITPTGSTLFESGSLDHTDKRVFALGNSGFPDSGTFASMFMLVNAVDTAIVTLDVPVKAAGTWASNGRQRFDFDTSGRLTYTGLEGTEKQITVNFRGLNDAGVNKDFSFYISKGNDTNNTITAFADSAADPGVDTTVTSVGHGLSVGDRVPITNTTNYNLVHTITRIVDADNFDIDFIYVANDATGNWALIIEESLSSNRFSTTDNKNTTVITAISFVPDDYVEFYIENNTDTTDFSLDQAKFLIR